MASIATVDSYVDDRFEDFLDDLRTLVAQPSISATGEGIDDCAALLVRLCGEYGFDEVRRVETSGHPAVIARAFVDNEPDNDAPTVLLYGHYDVQPVDPDEWDSPPFEPEIRETRERSMLYGRGSVDNKGQHFAYICAVRALRETIGLPVNVTLLLDGEEERGSPNLTDAVEKNRSELNADVAINSDGPVDESGRPLVVFGNRGILVVQLDVDGPKGDLHSGHYGGAVPNPIRELTRLLGTMKDDDDRITIEGFYDDVRPVTDADRKLLDRSEPDPDELAAELEIDGFDRGPGETFLERTLLYPTLNVNGITGGHGGEGFKTIVPAEASATIDMRLVVDQEPDEIYERFVEHVETHADDRVTTTVSRLGSMDPARTPVDSPYREPIVEAVAEGWGEAPIVKPSSGGSAPYAIFTKYLGLDHISVPYGQQDNNQHAANEHFAIDHFEAGIRTSVQLLRAVTAVE